MSLNTLERLGFIETYMLSLNGTSSENVYTLDTPLQNVISVEVCSALVPRAEYTIDRERDSIFNRSLPHRDYSASDLVDELGDTFSLEAGFFKFKVKLPIDLSSCTICRVIGFDSTYYDENSGLEEAGDGYYWAPYRYNMMGTEVVLLESDLDSQINHSKLNDVAAPLAKFYVSDAQRSQFVQLINYEQPARHFHPIGKLRKISLQFKRAHAKDVYYNFNGLTYYLQVVVKCISYGKNWGNVGDHVENGQTDQTDYILRHLVDKINSIQLPEPSNKENCYKNNYKIMLLGIAALTGSYFLYNKKQPSIEFP
jgi:hypothetical protein